MDARDTGWAGWRRGRALAEAERQQEAERAVAGRRLGELAQSWDGPTSGWPLPPPASSSLQVGSASYPRPDPASLRRQVRSMYVVAFLFVALAVAVGVMLVWGRR